MRAFRARAEHGNIDAQRQQVLPQLIVDIARNALALVFLGRFQVQRQLAQLGVRLAQRAVHQHAFRDVRMRHHHAQRPFAEEAADPGLRPPRARARGKFVFQRKRIGPAGNDGADAGGQLASGAALPARVRFAKFQVLQRLRDLPDEGQASLVGVHEAAGLVQHQHPVRQRVDGGVEEALGVAQRFLRPLALLHFQLQVLVSPQQFGRAVDDPLVQLAVQLAQGRLGQLALRDVGKHADKMADGAIRRPHGRDRQRFDEALAILAPVHQLAIPAAVLVQAAPHGFIKLRQMRAAAEEGRVAADGLFRLVAGDGGKGRIDGNDAVAAVGHQHAFADGVEDDEGAPQGRFARQFVAQVRDQHARRGAVRIVVGLDAHHAARAARLTLEQLRFEHLARAAGEDGVEEAAEAALRLGRDELLEAPSQQAALLAPQQAAGSLVGARDDAFARQRKITDGRLFVQLRITVAAAFKFIFQLLQLGQRGALHLQLDLADLQLMHLPHQLFIRQRRHRLTLLRRQLLGLLPQPGRHAAVEWLAHAAPSPLAPSFCICRSWASSSFDSVMLMKVTTTPSITFSIVR